LVISTDSYYDARVHEFYIYNSLLVFDLCSLWSYLLAGICCVGAGTFMLYWLILWGTNKGKV